MHTLPRTVLRSGDGMQIEIHSNPVFPCPLKDTQNVANVTAIRMIRKRSYNVSEVQNSRPTHFLEEGLEVPFLNCPERNRQTYPIQSCSSNFRNVLLGLRALFGVKEANQNELTIKVL